MKTTQVDERLPEGTVTFLFTDIEGSTELLQQLGDEYAALLAEQREILRKTFSRWNGQEVDTQGDSFFVSFPRATQAVSAAVDIQRTLHDHNWPAGVNVRLRRPRRPRRAGAALSHDDTIGTR
jgi:class 3 adenylate cyclase